jgi:hypothetical protein
MCIIELIRTIVTEHTPATATTELIEVLLYLKTETKPTERCFRLSNVHQGLDVPLDQLLVLFPVHEWPMPMIDADGASRYDQLARLLG